MRKERADRLECVLVWNDVRVLLEPRVQQRHNSAVVRCRHRLADCLEFDGDYFRRKRTVAVLLTNQRLYYILKICCTTSQGLNTFSSNLVYLGLLLINQPYIS